MNSSLIADCVGAQQQQSVIAERVARLTAAVGGLEMSVDDAYRKLEPVSIPNCKDQAGNETKSPLKEVQSPLADQLEELVGRLALLNIRLRDAIQRVQV